MALPTKISVVIPTYQRRNAVLRALQTVMAQDRPADEVVVVDDGSTDGTAEAVANEYGGKVRVLRQANRGPSAARNAAVQAAEGDLIAFLDSDNRWLPGHLTFIEALAEAHPRAVLVSTQLAFRFGEDSVEDARCADLAETLVLGTACIGLLSGVAVRRQAYLAAGGFDENSRYGEDEDLYLRLSLLGPMALVAASTFVRGESPDSLFAEGKRRGAFLEAPERSAASVLAALDKVDRADALAIREAAATCQRLGAATTKLAIGEPARQVRADLAEVCRRGPALRANPASIPFSLRTRMPGWDRPGRRLRVLGTLVRAWPEHSGPGFARLSFASLWCALFLARPGPGRAGRQRRQSERSCPCRPRSDHAPVPTRS